ncbi:hypothetical protein D3C77_151530 [compost metagenome]|jgi:hypothetical protein
MHPITQVDSTLWALINRLADQTLQTPYTPRNCEFRIDTIANDRLHITTGEGDTPIQISREAIQRTLDYLVQHEHIGQPSAIQIKSSHQPADAGPLCLAARTQPDGTVGVCVITYILPILERCHAVGISRMQKPTSTWLLS